MCQLDPQDGKHGGLKWYWVPQMSRKRYPLLLGLQVDSWKESCGLGAQFNINNNNNNNLCLYSLLLQN